LRLLRYVRLKHKYNLKDASKDYSNIFKKHVHLLKNLPVERLRQEFDKILIWNNNVDALQELKDIWFLKLFIKEVDILDTIPWNKWHLEWDVWIHTKMCIKELNKIILDLNLSINDKIILYYTLLFHDIAKADTLTFDDTWESHYFKHENIWAEIFKEKISNRLNFTNIQKREIYWLIKNHIKLFLIPEMKKLKARKFMMHRLFEKLLIIWDTDNRWRIPVKDWKIEQITSIYQGFKVILKHKKFLNGNDIILKYPDLSWRKIWERLTMLNDQILIDDIKIN
jgi:tRNA nucleotidyltransferase/poly(A) polymerase